MNVNILEGKRQWLTINNRYISPIIKTIRAQTWYIRIRCNYTYLVRAVDLNATNMQKIFLIMLNCVPAKEEIEVINFF